MKKLLFLFSGIFMAIAANADVIPIGEKYLTHCVKIINADSFPDVSLVLRTIGPGMMGGNAVLINDTSCLYLGYKFNSSKVYAVNKNYFTQKGLANIDYENDKNLLISNIPVNIQYILVPDSSSKKEVDEFYRVLGFTDTSAIIYLSKLTEKFSNGSADSVYTYKPPVVNNIKNFVPVSVKPANSYKSALIFPNPSQNELNICITDGRSGIVEFELFDMAGHKLKTAQFTKNQDYYRKTIEISDLPAGVYNVKYSLGNYFTENRLILKK
jgi:hypothetical protein